MIQGKNRLIAAGLVLVAGVSLVMARFSRQGKESLDPSFGVVTKGTLRFELELKGRLKPVRSVVFSAPRRGGKITYLIPEGTYVKKGDVLIQFEKEDLSRELQDAQFALEEELVQEERRRHEANKKIEETRLKLEQARRSFRQTVPEVLAGKKTSADLKWAKYSLKEAEINHEMAKRDYEQYEVRGSPNLRKAKDKLKRAQADLAEAEVRSSSVGLAVYESTWRGGSEGKIRVGDSVWRNQEILSLPDLSEMLVTAEVSEVDLAKVEGGQSCVIRVDAYSDQELKGTVRNKGSLVRESSFSKGVNVVEIEARIEGEHAFLRPGMTAAVRVLLSSLEGTLSVPLAGVFEEGDERVCFVQKGKGFDKRVVKHGASNNDRVVVLEGLEEGEKVALFRPEGA